MKKIIVIVSIVLILAATGVAAWLFVSEKIAFVAQANKPVTPKVICNTEIVNTFNDAMFYTRRAGASTVSVDDEGIKNLNTNIKSSAGYETDPTCQTILYLTAIYKEDYEAAKVAYLAVKELHDKRVFADSNIRGNQPLFMYEDSMYALSPEGKKPGGVGSAGGE